MATVICEREDNGCHNQLFVSPTFEPWEQVPIIFFITYSPNHLAMALLDNFFSGRDRNKLSVLLSCSLEGF